MGGRANYDTNIVQCIKSMYLTVAKEKKELFKKGELYNCVIYKDIMVYSGEWAIHLYNEAQLNKHFRIIERNKKVSGSVLWEKE